MTVQVLQAGDTGEAICPRCEERVSTHYEYRTLHLEETDVDVENVLVGVCDQCQETVTVPAQSTPKLKVARKKKEETVEARVPRPLEDLVFLIADEVGSSGVDFRNQLVRYYLIEIGEKDATARRVRDLAETGLAQAKKDARISVRVDADTLRYAMQRAEEQGVKSQADMIRGILIAGAQDVLGGRATRRRRELERIAAVA